MYSFKLRDFISIVLGEDVTMSLGKSLIGEQYGYNVLTYTVTLSWLLPFNSSSLIV